MLAKTPTPPYYAVIFTSIKNGEDAHYHSMAEYMLQLVEQQDGFLGFESAEDELGITVSYWRDLEAIRKWKSHSEHQVAQEKGKEAWYKHYKTRIALVERDYEFHKDL